MDEHSFGELTKRVAAAPSRRGVLRTLSGGMAAGLLGAFDRSAAAVGLEQAVEGEGFCKTANFPCRRASQCCAKKCAPGTFFGVTIKVCGCNKRGKDCIQGLGQTCCSRRCKRGKCA